MNAITIYLNNESTGINLAIDEKKAQELIMYIFAKCTEKDLKAKYIIKNENNELVKNEYGFLEERLTKVPTLGETKIKN